jgi:hypothetical protein
MSSVMTAADEHPHSFSVGGHRPPLQEETFRRFASEDGDGCLAYSTCMIRTRAGADGWRPSTLPRR